MDQNEIIKEKIFSSEYRVARFAKWLDECERLNMFPFAMIMLNKKGDTALLTSLQTKEAIAEIQQCLNKLHQATGTNTDGKILLFKK